MRTRRGRSRFDTALKPLTSWSGWRLQRIEGGTSLAFLGAGEERLATLELTADGHVVYTPDGGYAASGSPPDHLYWVEANRGHATRLTAMPAKRDPALIRKALATDDP